MMVTMHGYGTREQCMSILFIAEKSKYAAGKKKKKRERNANLDLYCWEKKKRGKKCKLGSVNADPNRSSVLLI